VGPAGSGFSRWARQAAQQQSPAGANAPLPRSRRKYRAGYFYFSFAESIFPSPKLCSGGSCIAPSHETFCAKNFTIARSIFYRDALAQAIAISAIGANDYLCAQTDEHSVSAHAELQIPHGSHCDLRATQAK
jgi:hypothetical protein